MTPPEREIHFHFHIGSGTDTTQLVAEIKAATAAVNRLEKHVAELDTKLDSALNKLNQLKTHITTETQQVVDKVARFQTVIDDMTAQRDALQKIIDSGTELTPEQKAKFDQIESILDDVTTSVDQIDPETTSTIPPVS